MSHRRAWMVAWSNASDGCRRCPIGIFDGWNKRFLGQEVEANQPVDASQAAMLWEMSPLAGLGNSRGASTSLTPLPIATYVSNSCGYQYVQGFAIAGRPGWHRFECNPLGISNLEKPYLLAGNLLSGPCGSLAGLGRKWIRQSTRHLDGSPGEARFHS